MSTVGFVGLGAMGAPIAGRLLSQGHTVYGTNRTRSKAAALIGQGLLWCDSPREVAQSADVVFSMVTDDAALDALTTGPDGILSGLAAGKVYVDMSTVGPQFSRALAKRGGIEPDLALDVLTHSAIGSPMLQARAPMLLDLPERAWFDVRMMRKDLHLALDTARELHVPLPSTAVADELLSTAGTLGYEHRDIAVLLRVLSETTSPPPTGQPGRELP